MNVKSQKFSELDIGGREPYCNVVFYIEQYNLLKRTYLNEYEKGLVTFPFQAE